MKRPEMFEEFIVAIQKSAWMGHPLLADSWINHDKDKLLEIWDAMQPQCQHDFAAAYDYGQPQSYKFSADTPTNVVVQILEATKAKTYRGHVCKKCGKTVNKEGGK